MPRAVLSLHRWLGIALGWLVTLWCLSGAVMMYVQYPQLSAAERLAGLAPLDLSGCCAPVDALPRDAQSFSIAMFAARPVLRYADFEGRRAVVALDGRELRPGCDSILAHATGWFDRRGLAGEVRALGVVERDQWTVAGGFDALRPFCLVDAGDAAGHRVYVSLEDGTLAQASSRAERAWNYPGAVAHWLYPTVLRRHPALWSAVVIVTSGVALFLAILGVWIGIDRLRRGHRYRGLKLWHHYAGLGAGVLTLTWLASGLLSMNPGGLFASPGPAWSPTYPAPDADRIETVLAALPGAELPAGTVQLDWAPFAGEAALAARTRTGDVVRLDARTLAPAPLTEADFRRAAAGIGASIRWAGWLAQPDHYYYPKHDPRSFPVYRIVLDDAGQTRYYLDARDGRLAGHVDPAARGYRWAFSALHNLDFTPGLRRRPIRDLVVLLLLGGVTVSTVTGTVLGLRRARRRDPPSDMVRDSAGRNRSTRA